MVTILRHDRGSGPAEGLHTEKHINAVFGKLDLDDSDGVNRRGAAVVRCLSG